MKPMAWWMRYVLLSVLLIILGEVGCHADGTAPVSDMPAPNIVIRSVRFRGHTVPPALVEQVRNRLEGKPYSAELTRDVQHLIADSLSPSSDASDSAKIFAVTLVEPLETFYRDTADPMHQVVDITFVPADISIYRFGSHFLPILKIPGLPASSVPRAKVGPLHLSGDLYADRAFGVQPTLRAAGSLLPLTSRSLLDLDLEGGRSLDRHFYQFAGSLDGKPADHNLPPRWSLRLGGSTELSPLGRGDLRRDTLSMDGSYIATRSGRRDLSSPSGGEGSPMASSAEKSTSSGAVTTLIGGTMRWYNNRQEAKSGRLLGEGSDLVFGARSVFDRRIEQGRLRAAFWGEGAAVGQHTRYQRLAGLAGVSRVIGSGHQTVGIEVLGGAGWLSQNTPAYARFYGGNNNSNFLFDAVGQETMSVFPTGPILRSYGYGEVGTTSRRRAVTGGQSYWHLNLNLTVPIKRLSKPLIPEDQEELRTFLRKGVPGTAESSLNDALVNRGYPDNDATTKIAHDIIERDVRPVTTFVADRANIYAIKPLLLLDVAQLGDSSLGDAPLRIAAGGGLQVNVVTARFELGYAHAIRRAHGDPAGAFFLRMVVDSPF